MTQTEQGFRYRDPAPQTLKFMEEQQKINVKIETFMATTKGDIEYIKKALDENVVQHKEIMSSLANLKDLFIKVLLAIGTAAVVVVVSYLLIRAGLPPL